jgi:hypothetical protein
MLSLLDLVKELQCLLQNKWDISHEVVVKENNG